MRAHVSDDTPQEDWRRGCLFVIIMSLTLWACLILVAWLVLR